MAIALTCKIGAARSQGGMGDHGVGVFWKFCIGCGCVCVTLEYFSMYSRVDTYARVFVLCKYSSISLLVGFSLVLQYLKTMVYR